jgi:phosphoribosylformylglycinamidine (FGAM) synthase-like amidotransferase family enzyme
MELKTKVLILYGDGINAQKELQMAFVYNGLPIENVELIHVNQLISNPKMIHEYSIIGFPGGFSFGDEIRSGKILALKLKDLIKEELKIFIADKKLIIGICNGFQILMQLNIFDQFKDEKTMTLTENDHGEFRNFWTRIKLVNNHSPWFKKFKPNQEFFLPVRHKEGRIFGVLNNDLIALTYEKAINGSVNQTAGLLDHSGQVLGLMPHPEAALFSELTPSGIDDCNANLVNMIFKSAIEYVKELNNISIKERLS